MFFSHLTNLLKRHRLALILGLIISLVLLGIAFNEDKLFKTFCYLLALGICFLISELFIFYRAIVLPNWKINRPKEELGVIIMVVIFATALLIYWFTLTDPNTLNPVARIGIMIFRLLFNFPIFLLIYFLAIRKYKLSQLGFWNFKHWYIALPMILVIGLVSVIWFSSGLQFEDVYKNNGIGGFILLGFLTAAIPEEMTRSLFQSRLGRVLNNKSLAWFLVSFIWAAQHIPTFAFNSDNDYEGAVMSALAILPIGLLWSYLNERYKSIIPSVLIHGTNLWGLQNLF